MKILSLLLLVTLVTIQPALAAPATKRVLNVGTRPESVTKGFKGLYYLTVMGAEQPGDATIRVIDGENVRDFATGLDEPKGIAFTGKYLVTTDVKKVWKIDADGQKSVLAEEKDFPHAVRYLNDTAAAPGGKSVYVVDMGDNTRMFGPNGLWPVDSAEAKEISPVGRVYKIDMDGRVTVAVDASRGMLNPNGVSAPRKDTLLVAEFFGGDILEIKDGKTRVLKNGLRGADGIERDKKGNLYISSWTQGKVWRLDRKTMEAEILLQGLQSAADFYLDEKARQLLVPDMKAGTLTFLPL